MSPEEFETKLRNLEKQFGDFYHRFAPVIAGKVAVDFFKQSFQTESWERVKWQDVQRRMGSWERDGKVVKSYAKGAATERKILTGETADLGRSIEIDQNRTGNGKATVWTSPNAFANSRKIYAAVHNEGLRAGRGAGFTMPKRQFMGNSPTLNKLIIEELERKLSQLINK